MKEFGDAQSFKNRVSKKRNIDCEEMMLDDVILPERVQVSFLSVFLYFSVFSNHSPLLTSVFLFLSAHYITILDRSIILLPLSKLWPGLLLHG